MVRVLPWGTSLDPLLLLAVGRGVHAARKHLVLAWVVPTQDSEQLQTAAAGEAMGSREGAAAALSAAAVPTAGPAVALGGAAADDVVPVPAAAVAPPASVAVFDTPAAAATGVGAAVVALGSSFDAAGATVTTLERRAGLVVAAEEREGPGGLAVLHQEHGMVDSTGQLPSWFMLPPESAVGGLKEATALEGAVAAAAAAADVSDMGSKSAAALGCVESMAELQTVWGVKGGGAAAPAEASCGLMLNAVEELGKGYKVWYVTVPREGGVKS